MAWLAVVLLQPILFLSALALGLDRRGRAFRSMGPADVIVVLGARIHGDRPGPAFERRLAKAAELFHAGVAPRLLVTGGPPAQSVTEAELGRDVLVSLGVGEDRIALEPRAANTRENAVFTCAMTTGLRLLVVTDAFHAPRARKLFARYEPRVELHSVSGGLRARVHGAVREALVLVHHLASGALDHEG